MGDINLSDIIKTNLKKISHTKGDILKVISNLDYGFDNFGEAYFSKINPGDIKGWKYHKKMKLNLVVPSGKVRFVFYDNSNISFREEVIGEDNYCRLTVPPRVWFAFQGLANFPSLILNIANIAHDQYESVSEPIESIKFDWEKFN